MNGLIAALYFFFSNISCGGENFESFRDPKLFVEIVYGKALPNGFKVIKFVNKVGLSDHEIEKLFRAERKSDRFIGLAGKSDQKPNLDLVAFDVKENNVIVTSNEIAGRIYPMSRKTFHLWLERKLEINWDQW